MAAAHTSSSWTRSPTVYLFTEFVTFFFFNLNRCLGSVTTRLGLFWLCIHLELISLSEGRGDPSPLHTQPFISKEADLVRARMGPSVKIFRAEPACLPARNAAGLKGRPGVGE